MNLPLNIDWQQILLHFLNFAILAFGLYMLLYKPIKAFMDKRAKYYEDIDKNANEKMEQIKSLETEYNSKISNLETEIKERKLAAEELISSQTQKELELAHTEANRIVAEAKAEGQAEKEKIIASSKKEIVELAIQASDKILKEQGKKDGK